MPCVRASFDSDWSSVLTVKLAQPSLLSRAAALPHDEATVPAHACSACHGLMI